MSKFLADLAVFDVPGSVFLSGIPLLAARDLVADWQYWALFLLIFAQFCSINEKSSSHYGNCLLCGENKNLHYGFPKLFIISYLKFWFSCSFRFLWFWCSFRFLWFSHFGYFWFFIWLSFHSMISLWLSFFRHIWYRFFYNCRRSVILPCSHSHAVQSQF